MNNLKSGILLTAILSILSCSSKPIYSEKNDSLPILDIRKIEFRNPSNLACQNEFDEFEISERGRISEFAKIMNASKLDGPWKGACFKEINLILKDSVITILTNGEVFGHGPHGSFYRFPESEIIEKFRTE